MQEPPKIILVGNSNNVLENKFGGEIDKFDIIVRFNDHKLQTAWHPYVGSKTTHVFYSRSFTKLANRLRGLDVPTVMVLPQHAHLIRRGGLNVIKIETDFNRRYTLESSPIEYVYSSGVTVAYYFKHNYPDSDIVYYGICDGGTSHYWNKRFRVFYKHNLTEDKKVIDKLGIVHLKDYLSERRPANDI